MFTGTHLKREKQREKKLQKLKKEFWRNLLKKEKELTQGEKEVISLYFVFHASKAILRGLSHEDKNQ